MGGTGELCGAMAEGLAAAGAEVVLVGRNEAKAAPRLERIKAAGGKGYFHPAEASDKGQPKALLDAVIAKSGRVDIVINGAGVNSATPFLDITEEEFDRIIRVNLKGVFLGCQVFGKYLVERGQGGSIINLGSMSGIVPPRGLHILGDEGGRPHPVQEPCPRMGAEPSAGRYYSAGAFFRRSKLERYCQPTGRRDPRPHAHEALRGGSRTRRRDDPAGERRGGRLHNGGGNRR